MPRSVQQRVREIFWKHEKIDLLFDFRLIIENAVWCIENSKVFICHISKLAMLQRLYYMVHDVIKYNILRHLN